MATLLAACAKDNVARNTRAVGGNPDELVRRVHFPTDSSEIASGDLGAIMANAKWTRENPYEVLVLEGHCDERGSDDYNLSLGDQRARSVKAAMIERGADGDSLIVVSHGERRPLDPSHTQRAWRMNRRVEFTVR